MVFFSLIDQEIYLQNSNWSYVFNSCIREVVLKLASSYEVFQISN